MCGVVGRSASITRWSAWLIGHIVIRRYGRDSIIVEFEKHFAFGVAICLAVTAVFFLSVEHFVPSIIERILCRFKASILLFLAPHSGDKSLLEAFLFHLFFRDDECIITQTDLLFGDWLVTCVFGIVVVRQRPRNVFAASLFVLLHGWGYWVFIVLGVFWGVISSCVGIAIFTMAWFRAVPLSSVLRLLLRWLILNWVLFVVAIVIFRCIHHVYVI